MANVRPKLTVSAPSAEAMAARQQAAEALVAKQTEKGAALDSLEDWTETPITAAPAQPVPPAPKAKRAPTTKTPRPPKAEEPAPPSPAPKKPWEEPSPDATHPYHVILSERLFRKMDFAWKRKGYKSAREFTLLALEAAADKALKELGETP